MKRRSVLKALVAGGGAAIAAPAISKGLLEWRMVTSWPKGLPGLGTGAERLAANERITVGDLFHLLGNMLPLWVFGRRVEDACGHWRFLAFYLFAGTWANILYIVVLSDSPIPGIGASGAIFGLMGAYLLLYPGGRIRTLVFISFVPLWPRIRAIWVVLYFFGIQIIPAIEILMGRADYRVNYWAHLGGFFSAVFILLFVRPEAYSRYMSDVSV